MVARLHRPGFARNAAVLAGGAAGAQLINAVASPVLTRLFDPSEIGQLGLYLTFTYVASMALSFRYEQAIVVPPSVGAAAALTLLAVALVPVVAILASLVLLGLINAGLAGYGTLPLVAVPIAAIGLLAFGWYGVGRYWLIRHQQYRVLSEVALGQSIGRAASQVLAGLAGIGVAGLLVGEVIGRTVGLGRMTTAVRRTVPDRATAESLRPLVRRYWRFPVLGMPSSLINAAAFTFPIPLLAAGYGLEMAGYFALVQRVLGLPMSIIGSSVGDTLLAHMASLAHGEPSGAVRLFRRTALTLAAIGFPIGVVVAAIGPGLFALVFGEEWRAAGVMASIMAPWYFASLIVSPLSRVAVVYEAQGSKLLYDVLSLVIVVGAIAGGAAAGLTAGQAVVALSVLEVVAYLVYLLILDWVVRRSLDGPRPHPG